MGTFDRVPGAFLPMPAVARILSHYDRASIEAFIAIAIELADTLDGDPEAEEVGVEDSFQDHCGTEPGCPISDSADDQSWREWHNLPGAMKCAGGHGGTFIEDAEDDDPDRAHDEGEPDFERHAGKSDGPGCEISDTGGDEHDGREPGCDAETVQMEDDVPMLPVVSLAHNVFTDARVPVGISNLQSSFRSNGRDVLSADSGATHQSSYLDPHRPGSPV